MRRPVKKLMMNVMLLSYFQFVKCPKQGLGVSNFPRYIEYHQSTNCMRTCAGIPPFESLDMPKHQQEPLIEGGNGQFWYQNRCLFEHVVEAACGFLVC